MFDEISPQELLIEAMSPGVEGIGANMAYSSFILGGFFMLLSFYIR